MNKSEHIILKELSEILHERDNFEEMLDKWKEMYKTIIIERNKLLIKLNEKDEEIARLKNLPPLNFKHTWERGQK